MLLTGMKFREGTMKISSLIIFILVINSFKIQAARSNPDRAVFFLPGIYFNNPDSISIKEIRKKKVTAIGLALALGPFGVHRLYLGTEKRVPVIYSITLGAFGLLPLSDIIAIASQKDFTQFENNQKIVMWLH